MIDFSSFLECKGYLAPKDGRLAPAIARKILKIVSDEEDSVRLLDIGTGEGSLVAEVCRLLVEDEALQVVAERPRRMRVFADCVEPCAEGITRIRQLAKASERLGIALRARHTTIEDYLRADVGLFDSVICCHTLYHVMRSRWKSLLEQLVSVVRPGGVLIVNLVSSESDIYRIRDKIVSVGSVGKLPRTFSQHGYEYYAEDMERYLAQSSGGWERETVTSTISFTAREVSEAESMLLGRGSISALVDFLAFMFRFRPHDLADVGREVLLRVLSKGAGGVSFRSVDRMFSLVKGY